MESNCAKPTADSLTDGNESDQSYTMTALCNEFGITARTLRFYEKRQLLSPAREAGARVFSQNDRLRLQQILRYKRHRFTLTEIAEILELHAQPDGQSARLQAALPQFETQLNALRAEQVELADAIADLESLRDQLCHAQNKL